MYATINETRPLTWWDYDQVVISEKIVDYEKVTVLGTGSFGTVYLVYYQSRAGTKHKCALKEYIDVDVKDIKRETKILSNLSGKSKYIPLFYQTFVTNNIYSLLMEYCPQVPPHTYYDFTLDHIRVYIYHLLSALETCHSNGIVHADVKPSNLAIDVSTQTLKLLDFGHSIFYFKDHKSTCYVGTVAYKAPEILCKWANYSYPVDLWSTGRVMLDMLIPHQMNRLRGKNIYNQVQQLTEFTGSLAFETLCETYQLPNFKLSPKPPQSLPKYVYTNATPQEKERYKTHFTPAGMDLLERLLSVDPQLRISAKEALAHPFFFTK